MVIKRLKFSVFVESIKCVSLIFDVVDKHHAVSVVNLVLDNAGKEAFCFEADGLASLIKGTNADFGPARYFAVDFANT